MTICSLLLAAGSLLAAGASTMLAGERTAPRGNEARRLHAPANFVQPLAADLFKPPPKSDARTRRLMQAYYNSVVRWDDLLLERAQPVPGQPGCAYYGDGGHEENDIRPIAYAALVNAFLAEVTPPSSAIPAARRVRMRADAVAALNYLLQGHVTDGGACVNGKQWGNQWQSAMWARSAALAAWMLWPHLDHGLRERLARLVEFEADRFLATKPKSRQALDTGAEENAWNAQILALAGNMMPAHPRAPIWSRAAKLWMYNSLSVPADARAENQGDDDRPVRDWVCTTNAHPDFTVENHGIVHVGYLKTTISLLLENALPYLLTRSPVPHACQHHTSDGFEVILRCMAWDASPVYFSGNDWKLVHTQPTDVMKYALLSLLAGDRQAARLEALALDYTARLQRAEGGYYNVRRDLESGGMCATRLIAAYLAQAILGAGARPASATEFDRHVSGVTLLESGKVLLHRTPTKFASFSWGPKRMALALPENGNWVLWPHFASYLGQFNGVDASAPNARLRALRHEIRPDGFTVTGLLERFRGSFQQAFAYASLAGDVTVYIERLSAAPGFVLRSRETGIVGLEYELGRNERRLSGRHGTLKTRGVGGGATRVVELDTDWLNIEDRVGYVVRRWPERRNVMRFHDEVAGSGRVPKLEEWLSLIGEASPTDAARQAGWACLVTFLNQRRSKTADFARRVSFTVDGPRAVCRAGRDEVRVDFGSIETR